MNWIRIAVGIGRDPSIIAMARGLGVSTPLTTGCCVLVLTEIPTVSRGGDVSGVSDDALEAWAQWPGKRGKFATAFRAYLCTPEGVIKAWEKHNGAAIREADRRAEAMRERRKQRTRDGSVTGNAGVSVTVTPALTGRDETGRTTKQQKQQDSPSPKPAKPEAKYRGFPSSLCDAAHAEWLAKAGAVDYARFRKAFGPLFAIPEDVRPVQYPRNDQLIPAIRLYLSAIKNTPEARFRTVDKCAASLSGVVECLRQWSDPINQLDAVQAFLGVTQRRAA
jgi:hypothetical protein